MDFGDITIHIFLEMLVEWVFEFYVISTLMSLGLKKKSHFFIRFILGLILLIALSYPLAIFYYFYGNTIVGRSLVYLILFALAIGHHIFCYDEEKLKTLLFCDIAYLTQNTIYKLFLIIYSIIDFSGAFGPGPEIGIYKIIYYSSFFILITMSYLLFIRRVKKSIEKIILPKTIIFISLITILVSIILCSMFDIHFQYVEASAPETVSLNLFFVNISSDLLTILLDSSIIVLFFAYARRINLMDNITKMKYVISKSEEQYKITQETIESINIKYHDMKHKINKIVGNNLSKETLAEVNEVIKIYDSLIETGNKALDVILIEKSLICDSNKISFTKLVEGKAVEFLTTGDLFCLFGNILDNAIEATKKLKNDAQKYINLTVKQIGKGIVEIECQNYFDSNILFEGDIPKTLKKDKNNHGFGVKSIKNIVSKYSGSMDISAKENLFKIRIVIFEKTAN